MESPVTDEPAKEDRLDSWKEIATFLKRGVRTVQRWEKEEGFPVHRHQHAKLGSIYALRSEVRAWQAGRDQNAGKQENQQRVLADEGAPSPIKLLVLPFENLSRDPEQDYFSDGLTEEMITQLGRRVGSDRSYHRHALQTTAKTNRSDRPGVEGRLCARRQCPA
jgi:hypothetical protein